MNEILLTAAQSLLAVALLVSLRLDPRGAFLLFGLFIGQFVAPAVLAPFSDVLPFKMGSDSIHLYFSVLYVLTSLYLLVRQRTAVGNLLHGLRIEKAEGRSALVLEPSKPYRHGNAEEVLESVTVRTSYRG